MTQTVSTLAGKVLFTYSNTHLVPYRFFTYLEIMLEVPKAKCHSKNVLIQVFPRTSRPLW